MQETSSHISGSDLERLIESYRAHPRDERRLLQVLSMTCQPVDQANLHQVLLQLDWMDHQGRPLSESLTGRLLEHFIGEGLVIRNKGLLRCHPDILEVPAREAFADGTCGEIARAALAVVVLPAGRAPTRDGFDELRRLRNALYQGREQEVLRLIEREHAPFEPADYSRNAMLIRVCARPWDEDWLAGLPAAIRFQVCASLLTWAARYLREEDAAYELLEQNFHPLAGEQRAVAHVLVEQRLQRGRLDGVEALLAGDESDRGLALLGWLHFLTGDYDQAIAHFESALKGIGRRTRRRTIKIGGLPGVFYVLALLHRGERSDLETARKRIRMAIEGPGGSTFESVYRILDDTAAVLLGDLRKDQGTWLHLDAVSMDPYLELFRCLALHWLGLGPRARDGAKLLRFCQAARTGGYLWFAQESAGLLMAFGKGGDCWDVAREAGSGRCKSIIDLVEPREAWEMALAALKEVPQEADGQGKEPGSDQRLVWQLDCNEDYCRLEPREQKRTKRGGWTKGRPIALQRLHDRGDDLDFLTAEDRRICAQIVAETIHGHYGRYQKTYHRLDEDKALLAAVGHPLVFHHDAPDVPVEIVREPPVLEVKRESGQLLVRIEPLPQEDRHLVIRLEGNTRVRLIVFEPEHVRIAAILGPQGLSVPSAAEKQVLQSVAAIAPLLAVHSDIGGGSDTVAEPVPADPRVHLHLQPAGEGLRLDLYIQPFPDGGPLFRPGQGGATLFVEVAGKPMQTERDLAGERARALRVIASCPSLGQTATQDRDWDAFGEWDFVLDDPESALGTLAELQRLVSESPHDLVLEWPQGRKIRLATEAGLAQMKIGVHKQRDWFGIEGGLHLDDGRVLSMQQLLTLIGQSPGRFVRLGEDEFLQLSRELEARLSAIAGYSDQGRFHPLAAPAIDEAIGGMQIKAGKPWREQIQRVAEAQALEPAIPSTLKAELRDYQAAGYRWLARLAHWGGGACLADDMGLGKTLQALALVLDRAAQGPTLVLAPTSVCTNWIEEAQRFAPTLNPMRFGPGDRERMLADAGAFDLIICSYGLLQTEAERLADVRWHTIVADEAQAIKNAATKRSQAAMALNGDFRMITTGTPIENHLSELWNLFRFLNPGLLGSQERFDRRFAVPIEERKDQEARRRLKQLIRPFILRRLKSDVLSELPPRTEITLRIEPSESEAALYEALRRQALEHLSEPEFQPGQQRIRILTEITRLRRACCHPDLVMPNSGVESSKLAAFGEVLDELLDNRHKALVFSQFVDHLSRIRAYLDDRGVRYQYLDGSTPTRKRKAAVDAFQGGEGDLFLISLKAGGVGLNLTAADYVIHMDPWWNPAVEDQASDRAHRIGQERPVTVYRLVTSGTIEEKILDLHQHKRDLADSLLEGTDAGVRLSVEDMMGLLAGDGD